MTTRNRAGTTRNRAGSAGDSIADIHLEAAVETVEQVARQGDRTVDAIESLKTREQRREELKQKAADALKRMGLEPRVVPQAVGLAEFEPYFRDVLRAHVDPEARARLERDRRNPTARAGTAYTELRASLEQRAVSTSSNFANVTGPPNFIVDAFASGVQAESVLQTLLPAWPMPEKGIHVSTPQVTTASGAGSVAENAAVTSTDPVTALIDTPKSTIAGKLTVSDQLLDLGGIATDVFLAQELGASNAGEFERQIAVGSGTNELTGLFTTASIGSVTYTDATPTPSEWLQSLAQAMATMATNRKRLPDAIVVSARRWAWIIGGEDTALGPIFASQYPPVRTNGSTSGLVGSIGGIATYATAGIPANLGGSTNEDRPLVLYTPDLWLLSTPVQITTTSQHGTSLQDTVVAYRYAALIVKHASAIATLTGTGCVLPAGY
jgi:HK97 family phage major capsid protein